MDGMDPTPPLVFQNQLSGNLLRKFKNSNGWQKLWVVFTNFCLFFYKSHQVSALGSPAMSIETCRCDTARLFRWPLRSPCWEGGVSWRS